MLVSGRVISCSKFSIPTFKSKGLLGPQSQGTLGWDGASNEDLNMAVSSIPEVTGIFV